MKIAYVTTYDSNDVHAWSGLGQYIFNALQENGFIMESIGGLQRNDFLCRIKRLFYSRIMRKQYLGDREPALLKHYARQVEQALKISDADVVFSPGTIPIAYLKTNKPIIFWTDATFAGLLNFYPGFSNLCRESLRNGHKMEQMALTNASLAVYSSEWAANTAIQNYDVDPKKVKVIPFGANVNCTRTSKEIQIISEQKTIDVCKLLFLGVEWSRKGGDKALEVTHMLNRLGIRTELHIVGCEPPTNFSQDYIINHGFISKKDEKGRKQLDKLMAESHFLILPSKAECCAVVFAEASSFGLPSLSTKVGGIPTAIRDGVNGQTFALDDSPAKYCDFIVPLLKEKEKYNALAKSSFEEYSSKLNWTTSGVAIRNLIIESCTANL